VLPFAGSEQKESVSETKNLPFLLISLPEKEMGCSGKCCHGVGVVNLHKNWKLKICQKQSSKQKEIVSKMKKLPFLPPVLVCQFYGKYHHHYDGVSKMRILKNVKKLNKKK